MDSSTWCWAARPIQAGCILAPLAGRIVIGYDNTIRILSSQWGFRRIRFVFRPTSGFLDESDSQTIPIRQFGESVAPSTLLWDTRRNRFVYLEFGGT